MTTNSVGLSCPRRLGYREASGDLDLLEACALPSPDPIHDRSASSVVESGRAEKSKLAHVDGNPQRSDVAHPNYKIVLVPFGLSVRFRTALVLTPCCRHF
ncbi:hypothetical protein EHI47_38240 [Rhizobium leguminosarum]|uniref:Uncharacterized protein n=1 Tax=Rhizobium leguminosarum TaxID=384 RepID=A0A444HHP3_RHILE|nr:hypothetical protein EHI47_38240 [Rhizobium leguminosarum]